MRWLARLLGDRLPEGFAGELEPEEHVVAHADSPSGPLVATPLGLWAPTEEGARRIGWHQIGKATWRDGTLSIVEVEETGRAGRARLIADRRAARFPLDRPGKLPKAVRERVDQSIRSRHHKELPGGGAWFVQRKVPGVAGSVLQVRVEPGTDRDLVADIAREAAEQLP
jgi:hypothetical protein